MILTYYNHIAMFGDRLERWRLTGNLATETSRRL